MAVNLTRIYTKLGDDGQTHLGDMSRVQKTDPRIEAFGDIDELNAQIGITLLSDLPPQYTDVLRGIQNDLFDLGADLSVPPDSDQRGPLRVEPQQVEALETNCDRFNKHLAPLKSFVLPGGAPGGAHLHLCRAVCRRAERRVAKVPGHNPQVLRYLNRLSDLFFIMSRGVNTGDEALWDPGANGAARD